LAKNSKNRDVIEKGGGVEALVKVKHEGSKEAQEEAEHVLSMVLQPEISNLSAECVPSCLEPHGIFVDYFVPCCFASAFFLLTLIIFKNLHSFQKTGQGLQVPLMYS